ncbi:MAG TPA: N-acetyl-gamma-glutamyl-phosphate reductase, partial [Candidatus Limnocylindria bacterium]
GEAAKLAPQWLAEGRRIVDIGSDFRLKDPGAYAKWYGYTHPAPELLAEAVYGLTEFARAALPKARIVANPGCYPTAALLALAPATKHGLIGPDVIVDAKSGVSGAGHVVDDAFLYGTIDESVRTYGVPAHRHTPEIAQGLVALGGPLPRLTFAPHLIPMTRGLIATCYAPLQDGVTSVKVRQAYAEQYRGEPFVRVTSSFPATKATLGSNWCLVHAVVDEDNRRLVAIGVLDNLVKGAAGQAIQNFNVLCGLTETQGLETMPIWP